MDPDTQIFDDLVIGFKSGPLGHRAQLSVNVQDGIVTIAGRVNSIAERKTVERVANRVAGIRTLIRKIGAAALPLLGTDALEITRFEPARQDFV